MFLQNKREIKLSPLELVNLLSKNTYKENSIPLEDRLSRTDKIYNLCEGRNKAYSLTQTIFFDKTKGGFYASFKEIANLNNNPNACLYSLSNISLQEYKEKCIKVKKNARAEYMFSFVPSSRDSKTIYSLNYVRLFSLEDIENINPQFIEKRREEIRNNDKSFNYDGFTPDKCFSQIKNSLEKDGFKISNNLTDGEKRECITSYIQILLKNNPPRERTDLLETEEIKKFRIILLEAMFNNFCALENTEIKDENFYFQRRKLLQNIDGKNIYYAIIDVNKIRKEFIKEFEKDLAYKKKVKKEKENAL